MYPGCDLLNEKLKKFSLPRLPGGCQGRRPLLHRLIYPGGQDWLGEVKFRWPGCRSRGTIIRSRWKHVLLLFQIWMAAGIQSYNSKTCGIFLRNERRVCPTLSNIWNRCWSRPETWLPVRRVWLQSSLQFCHSSCNILSFLLQLYLRAKLIITIFPS